MSGFRKEKIASVIRRTVGDALAHRISDPRFEPFTTITRVQVTPDLLVARVYVSVPGNGTAERKTMAALNCARGFLQRLVAEDLNIRHCPELRFMVDVDLKEANRTLELLDELRKQRGEADLDDSPRRVPEQERRGRDPMPPSQEEGSM